MQSKKFQDYTAETLKKVIATTPSTDLHFQGALSDAITACFAAEADGLSPLEKAEIILSSLFYTFGVSIGQPEPFNLSQFLRKLNATQEEKQQLFNTLLYGLYYGEIVLARHRSGDKKDSFKYYIWHYLADRYPEEKLAATLKALSEDDTLHIIRGCYLLYREGAHKILDTLEDIYPHESDMYRLLLGLRRKYYFREEYSAYIEDNIDVELSLLIDFLEEKAEAQNQEICSLFPKLVRLMVDSPVRVYDTLEEMKGKDHVSDPARRHEAEKKKIQNMQLFGHFRRSSFSYEQIKQFMWMFGHYDHHPSTKSKGFLFPLYSLSGIIHALFRMFEEPAALVAVPKDELAAFFAFIYRFGSLLQAFTFNSEKFVAGLSRMVYALPTAGKSLQGLAWLPSVLRGISSICAMQKRAVWDFPIFIFDQSDDELFAQNQAYIQEISKKWKARVVAVKRQEALQLATIIGVEKLLDTTGTGNFGYGGARNCVYFLAPVLKAALLDGKKSIADILNLSKDELQAYFDKYVLGTSNEENNSFDTVVHMGDDDIKIPEANFFCETLFVDEFQHHFFTRPAFYYGRWTHRLTPYFDFKEILQYRRDLYLFSCWTPEISSAGMKGVVSKPKFCLNLPFGNEEMHFIAISRYGDLFQHPIIHLGGTRYPMVEFPSHRFAGLAHYLESYISYVFLTAMVQCLVDPRNRTNHGILPWNLYQHNGSGHFANLHAAFSYAARKATQQEMQMRFWNNMRELCSPQFKGEMIVCFLLDLLASQDPTAIKEDYFTSRTPSDDEKQAIEAMAQVFDKYKRDAQLFLLFAKKLFQVTEAKNLSEPGLLPLIERAKDELERETSCDFNMLPLTNGLYLLVRSVGAGHFCELTASLVK